MKYIKTLKLHDIEIHLSTQSAFIANLILHQFNFCKAGRNRRKNLAIHLDLEENRVFPYGRSDRFDTNKKNLNVECWLKSIDVKIFPSKNLIAGKLLTPTALPDEAIFDLLVIHPLRHILKHNGVFMLHAACLAKDKNGVLICGAFRSGKSTLAVKLVEDGFKFLSDELVIFNKERLLSFPLKVGLEWNSVKIFPLLKNLLKKKKGARGKIYFDIRDFYPRPYAKDCVPKLLIFPVIQKNHREVTPVPIDRKISFFLLSMDKDNSLPFEKNLNIRQRQIGLLGNLAKNTRAYCLFYGLDKIDEASKIIDKLFCNGT